METGSQDIEIGHLKVLILVTVEADIGIDSHHLATEEKIQLGLFLERGREYVNSMRVGIARKDLNLITYIHTSGSQWELNLKDVKSSSTQSVQ